ncbi:phage baseplate assembly protein V [Paenibacillus psychroresistens]|uniref:Phage baseplate assembly protein V n=1 Tax=Paenibacillus psychroresistens TaxID=1778678 RepID=A0A6B8RJX8_9BACL|nr:phage baseplate assembly protein V [Paenibacillus psychroresistens]QGQ95873.1 phage baseplate assembly protein V [Paenibacillus psychroresistens]
MQELIRVGHISSIAPDKAAARVTFADKSEVVTLELPIIVRGSLAAKDYWMPEPNEPVLCLFLPNGSAQGFILGSFYSKNNPPPVVDETKRYISFPDGTSIEYDMATSTMNIVAVGEINIVATGNVNVIGDVIADGISLKHHIHTDVTTGSGNTGEPDGGA